MKCHPSKDIQQTTGQCRATTPPNQKDTETAEQWAQGFNYIIYNWNSRLSKHSIHIQNAKDSKHQLILLPFQYPPNQRHQYYTSRS